jgi:hypothetical protein
MVGIDLEGQRKTFSIGGHFFDPLKLLDPWRLAKGKSSPFMRALGAGFTGSDWADRPFTGAKELITTGKTIKKSPYQEKEGAAWRLPSTIVNQIINMQPIQVGQFIRYFQGEADGLTALMSSVGAPVHTAWKPRITTAIIRVQDEDPVFDQVEALVEQDLLKMGPPARSFVIDGVSQRLTADDYDYYLKESSRLARPRIRGILDSNLSQDRKIDKIESVIRNKRRRVRSKIKRRTRLERRKVPGRVSR